MITTDRDVYGYNRVIRQHVLGAFLYVDVVDTRTGEHHSRQIPMPNGF